ncbi:MAG: hypothetical protein ACJATT_004892 [Myxococcota bacterium]|jgi:hypothetical protein
MRRQWATEVGQRLFIRASMRGTLTVTNNTVMSHPSTLATAKRRGATDRSGPSLRVLLSATPASHTTAVTVVSAVSTPPQQRRVRHGRCNLSSHHECVSLHADPHKRAGRLSCQSATCDLYSSSETAALLVAGLFFNRLFRGKEPIGKAWGVKAVAIDVYPDGVGQSVRMNRIGQRHWNRR